MKYCLSLVLCLLLAGCSLKSGTRQESLTPDLQPVLSPDQQLALFVGDNPPGSTASFADTSLAAGTVQATTYDAYVSALGEFCREAVVDDGRGNVKIAACKDKTTGQWRLAPAIFMRGGR